MGRYLDIADNILQTLPEFQDPDSTSLEAHDIRLETEDARRLRAAGYKPKVSFGNKVIWERPDTGFYVSEEMALRLLDRWNVRSKSGANARR